MAKILFKYMYRDASNWKQYGMVIFPYSGNLPVSILEEQIRAALHDGEWFIVEKVGLPVCFFNSPGEETDDDHPWHEFWQLTWMQPDTPANDPRDITDLIHEMQVWKQMGWESEKRPCCVCKEAFTDEEWEDRHELHEPDCHRMRFLRGEIKYVDEIGCTCNLVCHARCCSECNKPEIEPVEARKKEAV